MIIVLVGKFEEDKFLRKIKDTDKKLQEPLKLSN